MLRRRPCGACGALVDAQEGCRHWKPSAPSGRRTGWVKGRARRVAIPQPEERPRLGFLPAVDKEASGSVESISKSTPPQGDSDGSQQPDSADRAVG